MPAGLERGDRQRHPLDERLEAGHCRDGQSLALVQCGRVGKERRGVAVGAEAEQDEVERLVAELCVIRRSGFAPVLNEARRERVRLDASRRIAIVRRWLPGR